MLTLKPIQRRGEHKPTYYQAVVRDDVGDILSIYRTDSTLCTDARAWGTLCRMVRTDTGPTPIHVEFSTYTAKPKDWD